jgi:hypothetical protein
MSSAKLAWYFLHVPLPQFLPPLSSPIRLVHIAVGK